MSEATNNYVLAIDVGFRSTGLALFDIAKDGYTLLDTKCCCPKVPKKTKDDYVAVLDARQCMQMASEIACYINYHKVERVVVELPSGGAKSSRAVRLMGMASAMIAVICGLKDIPLEFLTPREIKIAATGKPKAEKDEIMDAMTRLFPSIKDIPKCRKEHIADACACMMAAINGKIVTDLRGTM